MGGPPTKVRQHGFQKCPKATPIMTPKALNMDSKGHQNQHETLGGNAAVSGELYKVWSMML